MSVQHVVNAVGDALMSDSRVSREEREELRARADAVLRDTTAPTEEVLGREELRAVATLYVKLLDALDVVERERDEAVAAVNLAARNWLATTDGLPHGDDVPRPVPPPVTLLHAAAWLDFIDDILPAVAALSGSNAFGVTRGDDQRTLQADLRAMASRLSDGGQS